MITWRFYFGYFGDRYCSLRSPQLCWGLNGCSVKSKKGDCGCGNNNSGISSGGNGDKNSNYSSLDNKPKINGVEINGDVSFDDLGLNEIVSNIVKDIMGGIKFSINKEDDCLQTEYEGK